MSCQYIQIAVAKSAKRFLPLLSLSAALTLGSDPSLAGIAATPHSFRLLPAPSPRVFDIASVDKHQGVLLAVVNGASICRSVDGGQS